MGRVLNDPGEDEWRIRFLTDGRSHKAADLRRESEVTILFQHDPDLAFVSLIGKAALHENASETRRRWKSAYDAYFPSETDRANAIFVEVEVERMELWIRGVTPEPFGLRATVLRRDAGSWRLTGG
jgi:general stress protein 26